MTRIRTRRELDQRDDHMAAAGTHTEHLCKIAEQRGLTGFDVAVSIAMLLAARNGTLAGKILMALEQSLMQQPVKPVTTEAKGVELCTDIELMARADGTYYDPMSDEVRPLPMLDDMPHGAKIDPAEGYTVFTVADAPAE